ncbi:MAG TPA: HEAT repeat domain-containing protein [Bryobacteraceae bacterium]|jgi:hypothetical protein|nr:HEAT repeat domain-containing protein [Bryobacteraceae bacterium]
MKSARLLILCVAALHVEAQPRVVGGKFETRAIGSTLEAEVEKLRTETSTKPTWVVWSVPAADREHNSCCYHSDNFVSWRGCALEKTTGAPQAAGTGGPVSLENPKDVLVLVRFEAGKADKIRTLSADCEMDPVDARLVFLSNAKPSESVTLLSKYLSDKERQRSAVDAIGAHADDSATQLLIDLARNSNEPKIRRSAVTRLGRSSDPRARQFIEEILLK